MTRSSENRCFRRFQETRDPRLLGKVFDATAAELLRVAGHLANGDLELTQDALQATFLTAIEHADSYNIQLDVRPWLLGILANHVRKERRRTVRQWGKDVTEVALLASDSPPANVQLAEFGTAAKAAMKQLPSPFREAIVLHLQHGLSAAEIGEALARPAGTVRTQIVRGMDRLRALLPAGFTAAALGMMLTPGPILAAVRSNVLATLPAVAVGSSSFVLTGWRLYTMIAASVMVVLSVVSSLWSPAVEPPIRLENAATMHRAASATGEPGAKRELVVDIGAQPQVQSEPEATVALDPNLQRIALKVVYADGKSAAHVPIGVFQNGALQTWQTGDRGRLSLSLPWPGLHTIYALGTDDSTHLLWHDGQRRPGIEKCRIEIQAGMALDLQVLDAAGQPIAGATVESQHGFAAAHSRFTTLGKTDATGRLRRQDLPARSAALRVWADGYQPSAEVKIGAKLGEVAGQSITLSKVGHRVRGVVHNENGEPLANAQLALVQFRSPPLEPQYFASGPDGRFDTGTLSIGRHVIVGMHFDQAMRRGELRFEHEGNGTMDVELRLTRGARIVGTLRNSSGRSYAGTNLVARDRPEAIHRLPFLETWTTSRADGTFLMDGLLPGVYALESEHVETKVVTVADGETLEWNPVRAAMQQATLRLLDSLGKPLSGWRAMMMPAGQDWLNSGTSTGDDGRLMHCESLFWLPPGSYCRWALFQPQGKSANPLTDFGSIPNLITPLMITGVEHEIQVAASATQLHAVVGQVVDFEGAPIANATVRIATGLVGSGGPAAKVDETGRFRFEGIPAGRRHAHVSMPGRPDFLLPALTIGPQPVAELALIKIPKSGRLVVTVPEDAVDNRQLRLQLTDAEGQLWRLRKQADSSWQSDELYFGAYKVSGFTDTTRFLPCEVQLNESEVKVAVSLVPHVASKLVVQLPHDYARNASGFSCDLKVLLGDRVVSEGRLSYSFHGLFLDRMEFLRSLPPGRLDLEVTTWNQRKGYATLTVPEGGGGEVAIQIE